MLLIKSRKQLIFSLTETTVSSRDERAHAPLSLSLSLSFCYDTLSPARHFRVSCTAVENFCHATSGMPPTSLETLLHQPISTISSFSAIFFRSPFHGTANRKIRIRRCLFCFFQPKVLFVLSYVHAIVRDVSCFSFHTPRPVS